MYRIGSCSAPGTGVGIGGISKMLKFYFKDYFKDSGEFSYMRTGLTLKCLNIGTPKAINFPFVSNEKLMFFKCPNIQAHCNEAVIDLNFRTPKNNEFSIWNKWKIYYF